MVGVHRHGKFCCVPTHIKVLQSHDEREGLCPNGGVPRLTFVEFLSIVFLDQNCSAPNITRVHGYNERAMEVRGANF